MKASQQAPRKAAGPPQKSPKRALGQMLLGYQVQQAIYVAARLGIADLLADGPKPAAALAEAAGAHPDALVRLLRTLASFGLFAEDQQGRFELTPMAALLQSGTPDSMRAYALWSGGVSYQAFGALEHSVRTGQPAFEHLFGMEFFEYLATHPDDGAIFNALMTRHTAPLAPMVAGYDFSGIETLVDVGGGHGELLAAILNAHPTLRGVLFDKPTVIAGAHGLLADAGVADRCATASGDLLEGVPPGGDAYLLKSVIHGLSDEAATRVLTHCREAMNDGGKLFVIELVLPPGTEPSPARLMDLLMLVGCYGRERTPAAFEALFAAAGFRLTQLTQTRYAYSVLEGAAA